MHTVVTEVQKNKKQFTVPKFRPRQCAYLPHFSRDIVLLTAQETKIILKWKEALTIYSNKCRGF